MMARGSLVSPVAADELLPEAARRRYPGRPCPTGAPERPGAAGAVIAILGTWAPCGAFMSRCPRSRGEGRVDGGLGGS
ncbi:hypothetical protein PSD17_60390 [Pseudonocardia sp. D17]|nr:hypothetical protein PSD17_60390 [Pseudonocardia sp. D17]